MDGVKEHAVVLPVGQKVNVLIVVVPGLLAQVLVLEVTIALANLKALVILSVVVAGLIISGYGMRAEQQLFIALLPLVSGYRLLRSVLLGLVEYRIVFLVILIVVIILFGSFLTRVCRTQHVFTEARTIVEMRADGLMMELLTLVVGAKKELIPLLEN